MTDFVIGVVGNPNCGKTTLFNQLTGARQQVGNWPGVTVERKTGVYQYQDKQITLVDLPGIYSLDVHGQVSIDEAISQQYILSGEADLIVNIIDAANLERNLYLTTQLLDMDVPVLIAMNMMDIAEQHGIHINLEELSRQLGINIVPIIAVNGTGIETLKQHINVVAAAKPIARTRVTYPEIIEKTLDTLSPAVIDHRSKVQQAHSRWICIKVLEGDPTFSESLGETLQQTAALKRQYIEVQLDEEVDTLVADSRYRFIDTLAATAIHKTSEISRRLSDRIDHVVLNRMLGIPIFLVVMYLMFMFTINLGGAFIDFFDQFTGTLLVDGVTHMLASWNTPAWLITLLANGIGGGIQVVATFIPIIGFLYLFLSFLEDSGYMARAAFVMDRFMRFIGLPGKSFVPLIVGFGCNVPAIMATRTLENPRDRYLTLLMDPFMSCGARLPVYALFAAAFFPIGGQNIVFGLYLLGIAAAVLTGFIMKHTLLQGEAGHFIMELPPLPPSYF
jgi:ferrous iron transport protein B